MPSPDEQRFLDAYDSSTWPRPSVTVDLCVFTVRDTLLHVLLVRRKEHPYKGRMALPGGFVHVGPDRHDQGEDLDDAAERELAEETGLPPRSCYLEQLGTFGKAGRDPRTRVISVAYYALVRPDLAPMVTAGTDAAEAGFFPVDAIPEPLAFDHAAILARALERVRGKIDYAPIAFDLVPETFTVADLRAVYEACKGESYDAGNFRRRFLRMVEDGLIEEAPGKRASATKPSAVYRFTRRR